jgi:hypothetical protein
MKRIVKKVAFWVLPVLLAIFVTAKLAGMVSHCHAIAGV